LDLQRILIDEEFSTFLPPLSPEELATLRAKIQREGFRGCLTIWKGHDILVDGHHRQEICVELGITDPPVEELEFPDRAAILDYMADHQIGRRNLNPAQAAYFIGREYRRKKQGRGGQLPTPVVEPSEQGSAQSERSLSPSEQGSSHCDNSLHLAGRPPSEQGSAQSERSLSPSDKTAKAIAAKTGLSASTVRRNEQVADYADAIGEANGVKARNVVLGANLKLPQLKELAEATPEVRQAVLTRLEAGERYSAAVKAVRAEQAAEEDAGAMGPEVLDEVGKSVPERLLEVFATRELFDQAAQRMAELKGIMNKLKDGPAGAQIEQEAGLALRNCRRIVLFGRPHAVCPECKGSGKTSNGKGCPVCGNAGWLTSDAFGRYKNSGPATEVLTFSRPA
jgi:hypothetical protein